MAKVNTTFNIGDSVVYQYGTERSNKLPFLLIHGIWAGAWLFEKWIDFLCEKDFRVYTVDLHGESPNIGKVSIFRYIEDVKKIIEKIGEVIVVGHSMGGLITQAVTQNNPLVKGAVFVTSAPPKGVSFKINFGLVPKMLKPKYISSVLFNKPFLVSIKDLLDWALTELEDPEFIAEKLVPESGKAMKEILFKKVIVDENKISCPTMVIGGEKDLMLPVSIQKNIAKKYNSQFKTFNSGHILMMEKDWKSPIQAIVDFAEKI